MTAKDREQTMDELEEMLIKSVLPLAKQLNSLSNDGIVDERKLARNLIAKIGLRISFGKEIVDQQIVKTDAEEAEITMEKLLK